MKRFDKYKLLFMLIFAILLGSLVIYLLSTKLIFTEVEVTSISTYFPDLNTHELLLFYNYDWKHQLIYDLDSKISIPIKKMRYQKITKDHLGNYWLATEGLNNQQSRLDIYDSKGKLKKSIKHQKDVPLVLKSLGNFVYYATLSSDSVSKVYVYNLAGERMEQIPFDEYIWDLYIDHEYMYIAAHDLKLDLSNLIIYDLHNKEMEEIELLFDYAPVAITKHDRQVILSNYHREDGKNGVISIYNLDTGSTENIEVPPSPGKLFTSGNSLFVFHYVMSSNQAQTISKNNLESKKVEEINIPRSHKIIFETESFYLVNVDKQTIKKFDYDFRFLEEYNLKIASNFVLNLGR